MYKIYNPILSYALYIFGFVFVGVIAYLISIGDDELYFSIIMAILSIAAFYLGFIFSKFTVVIDDNGITYQTFKTTYILPWKDVKSVGICLRKTFGGHLPYIYITAQEKDYDFIFIPDEQNFIVSYRSNILNAILGYWDYEVKNVSYLKDI